MFKFMFKLLRSKSAKVREYCGTWSQFEDMYPGAILVFTPEPLDI